MNKVTKLLDAINSLVNGMIEYCPEVKGEDDWQHPKVTLEKGEGDCEDFTLLKMFLLADVLPRKDLRLIYCKTRDGIPHMVLEYKGDVLDNSDDRLTVLEEFSKPVYQIDGTGKVYVGTGEPTPGRAEKFDKLLLE